MGILPKYMNIIYICLRKNSITLEDFLTLPVTSNNQCVFPMFYTIVTVLSRITSASKSKYLSYTRETNIGKFLIHWKIIILFIG